MAVFNAMLLPVAGEQRIELQPTVLETVTLPLHHSPYKLVTFKKMGFEPTSSAFHD